jgi:hypothetical protein
MAGLLDMLFQGKAPAGLLGGDGGGGGLADTLSPGRARRRQEDLRKQLIYDRMLDTYGLERDKYQLQKNADQRAQDEFNWRREREGVPSGFVKTPSGLAPIPGGPADPAYKRLTQDRRNTPAGYKFENPDDPDSNLMPIPGGPGEKIPAEVAARIGLAKSFLGQLEDYTDRAGAPQKGIRARIKEGQATGALDGPLAAFNIGQAGELKRLISSGSEALLRNLTGAGMGIAEASKYVKRYEPEWNDSSETLLSKVDQLERELISTIETVGKGRGVISPRPTQAPSNDGWSVQRIK